MRVSADQAKTTARAFAVAKTKAWDEANVVVSIREIDGRTYWAVTTTEATPSPATWETPLDTPYVDYLIDRDSDRCVGIENHRMTHWLPKSWQIGDND